MKDTEAPSETSSANPTSKHGTPGFYKRRRGILEHLESGKISLLDLAVHDFLNLKANLVIGSKSSIPAGVCFTSAVAIHAMCPAQISERAIQRSLEHMERIGFIKRFNVRGKHGNYPVLVCRGSVHDLSGNEHRVNGEETTDWRHPVYEPVGELSSLRGIAATLLSGDREVRSDKGEERKERRTPSRAKAARGAGAAPDLFPSKAAPAEPDKDPADPRHREFVEHAYDTFQIEHLQNPTWTGRDYKAVSTMLAANPGLDGAELEKRWGYYLDSDDPFIAGQGHSLAFFAGNIDRFLRGPICARRAQQPKTFDQIKREETQASIRKTLERHLGQIAAAKPALPSGNGRPALTVGHSRPAITVQPEKPHGDAAPLDSTVIAPAKTQVQVAVAVAPAKPVDVPVAAPAKTDVADVDVAPAETPRFTFPRPPLPKDEAIAILREKGFWPKQEATK
jgi:hypothetical protein